MRILRVFLRRRTSIFLTVAIASAITAFLCLYSNMLSDMHNQISRMVKEVPVTATISNRAGTATSMLEIRSEMLDQINANGISETSYAAMDLLTKNGKQVQEEFSKNEEWSGFTAMTVTNTLDWLLDDPNRHVTFAQGYSWENLQSDKPYCLLDKLVAEEKGLSPGEHYPVTIYRIYAEGVTKARRVGFVDLTVIGVFEYVDGIDHGQSIHMDGYLSDAVARNLFDANNIPYCYHTASLRITDPMQLNRWKQRAKEIGFKPIDVTVDPTDYSGIGLTVYDEVFINAVTPILQNISVFNYLYIPIFCIIAFIGGIVSYILINQQRREIALCRTLGMRKAYLSLGLIAENLIPCLFGMVLGSMITLPFVVWTYTTLWLLVSFVICYLTGCFISVGLINRDNVILTLTQTR